MPHETDAQSISHAGFLSSLTAGVFGAVYIRWSPSDKPKPWPGRTFYRDACAHPEPLLSRLMVPKTLNLFRTALTYGYDDTRKTTVRHIPPDAVSAGLVSALGKTPMGELPLLDLSRLAIGKHDEHRSEKVDELVLLLDLALRALVEDRGESDRQTVYHRMEASVFAFRDSLPISTSQDGPSILAGALAEHNDAAARRSGTYQLGEIARELVPGISLDAGKALFEYRNKQFPLLQCLKMSWRESDRPNLMLVGEGGIGKTVSMLAAAKELCGTGVPAVYIPLHSLPFLNSPGNFIRSYIERIALRSSESALAAIGASRPQRTSKRPSLVILLDGWNEISERQVMGNWLTDVIQEEIESHWLSSTNAQIVIAGRARMDSSRRWHHRWSYLKVQRLRKTNIRAFLEGAEVSCPPEDHPIWETLGNPLMLTLYTCSESQKDNCRGNACCRFIVDDRAGTQPAVIWNYLQCQVNKACLISKDGDAALSKIIAIQYAAAYIGWRMVSEGVFRITRGRLATLLAEAGSHFELVWKESPYVERASATCGTIERAWDAVALSDALLDTVKLLIDEAPPNASGQSGDDGAEYRIGFLHQNFRDFYAALFMRSEFTPFGTIRSPEDSAAWVETPQTTEILDMLGILFDDGELDSLWKSTEGVAAKDGSNAMFHVLEVMQRRVALSGLSFENRDLRFVSLQDRGFTGSGAKFNGSVISNRTFLPFGHSEEVSEAVWLPGMDGRDGDCVMTLGKTAILWDVRTGLPRSELAEKRQRYYSAAAPSRDGSIIALAVENCGIDIYDVATRKTTRHNPQNESHLYAIAPLPGTSLIACGGEDACAFLYDTVTGATTPLPIPKDVGIEFGYRNVKQITCSADGKRAAFLYESGGIALWAVNARSLGSPASFVAAYELGSEVNILQMDRDGSRMLAVTSEADLYVSEREDITSWDALNLEIEECDAVGVSLEHGLLAVALDNKLCIRPLRDEGQRKSITMATDLNSVPDMVYTITFSPSGDKVVCVHENNTVTAWDTRPSNSGLDERPLFATENKKAAFGGARSQRNGTFLTSTGLGRLLVWDASDLRCIGDLSLGGTNPDHWDSSSDGSGYYTSKSNLVRVYDASGRLVNSRNLKNRVQDIRLDERNDLAIIVENTPNIICLDAKTLNAVSSIGLENRGEFTIAPLDGKAIVGLDEQCRLTVRRLPGLEPIGAIDVWDAMARSGDEEIRRIGAAGIEGAPYIMSPEFAQLETFEVPGESGSYAALIIAEIAGLDEECFSLTAAIDLSEGVATMAFRDDLGDEITGVAVAPQMDRFFQSSLKGSVDSRRLSTGEYVESAEPIPNIMLVGADFRGAQFNPDTLKNMVRASGAIVGN